MTGKARKVKKGYVGVGGVARLFYSADAVLYTGSFTVRDITVNDKPYKLYTLLTSGTLTLNENARVWLCGGGNSGYQAIDRAELPGFYQAIVISGVGGAGAYAMESTLTSGTYPVVIGNGGTGIAGKAIGGSDNYNPISNPGGVTKVGALSVNAANGENGGSGGGGSKTYYKDGSGSGESRSPGKGDGKAKYPFGATSLECHCAGGAGGICIFNGAKYAGNGGSNGGDGTRGTSSEGFGMGGEKGGGTMRNGIDDSNKNATFYGSGGAGGGIYYGYNTMSTSGSGYQGVAYILVAA